jgi:hypothetical protein
MKIAQHRNGLKSEKEENVSYNVRRRYVTIIGERRDPNTSPYAGLPLTSTTTKPRNGTWVSSREDFINEGENTTGWKFYTSNTMNQQPINEEKGRQRSNTSPYAGLPSHFESPNIKALDLEEGNTKEKIKSHYDSIPKLQKTKVEPQYQNIPSRDTEFKTIEHPIQKEVKSDPIKLNNYTSIPNPKS